VRTILVVEDEYDVQQVVAEILRDEGYQVSVCGNGREAISQLRKHCPDVVVMDVMMPLLSGLQVLEEMEKSPGLKDVPVILMSEVSLPRSEPPRWRAFLRKPFRLEQLLNAVKRVSGVGERD
jgi:CheY-like chemotaxis protein